MQKDKTVNITESLMVSRKIHLFLIRKAKKRWFCPTNEHTSLWQEINILNYNSTAQFPSEIAIEETNLNASTFLEFK